MLLACLTLAAVTTLTSASASALPVASAPSAGPAATYGASAVKATNKARVRHDLRRLAGDDCLQRYAVRQARRMAAQQRMYHQDLGAVLGACGLTRVGENVAYGYPTGGAVVRGWMRSEGHRANILDRRYRLVAVAARRSDDGVWYAAQVFGRR